MQSPVIRKSLVWLASYPKSGNTWLRAFLGNYLFSHDGPLPLAALKRVSSGDSSMPHYAQIAGPGIARMGPKQMTQVRQVVLQRIAGQAEISLVKTHNANARIEGCSMIPAELTKLAFYVLRDPLDMLVSYADHFALDFEKAAEAIGSQKNIVPANARTVPQVLGNWSEHVKGWTRPKGFRTHLLRYEDMLADPEATFSGAIKALGAPVDPAQIARAIDYSSFDTLRKMEAETGFEEKGPKQEKFFRAGRSGLGRERLPQAVIERVIADHGATMKRHGYL